VTVIKWKRRFEIMTRVAKLEKEVQQLSRDELSAFRDWFRKYDSDAWDREIEKDILAGRLDRIAEGAITAHKAGRTKEL
jgi:hypothetical protein